MAGVKPDFALKGHKDSVLCLASSQARLLSGSEDGTARLWDLEAQKCQRSLLNALAENDPVNAVAFHPTEQHTVFVATQEQVLQYDLRAPEILLRRPVRALSESKEEVNQICVNAKGEKLVACDDSGEVHVYDLQSPKSKAMTSLKRGHSSICSACCFRGDHNYEVVSGGMDSRILIWDTSRGRVTHSFDCNPKQTAQTSQMMNPPLVHCLATTHSSKRTKKKKTKAYSFLASGLGNAEVVLYSLRSREELGRLHGHHATVAQVCFLEGVRVQGAAQQLAVPPLVSVGNDRLVNVWKCSSFLPGQQTQEEDRLDAEFPPHFAFNDSEEKLFETDLIWTRFLIKHKPNWATTATVQGNPLLLVADTTPHISAFVFRRRDNT